MSQTEKLFLLLSDYKPHSTFEIAEKVYGAGHLGCARIAARVFDLKKKLKQGFSITSWSDEENKTMTWYKLIPPKEGQLKLPGMTG